MAQIEELSLAERVEESRRTKGFVSQELVEELLAKISEVENLAAIGCSVLMVPAGSAMTIIAAGSNYVVIRQADHDKRHAIAFTKDVLLHGADAFNAETIDESEGEHGASEDIKRLLQGG